MILWTNMGPLKCKLLPVHPCLTMETKFAQYVFECLTPCKRKAKLNAVTVEEGSSSSELEIFNFFLLPGLCVYFNRVMVIRYRIETNMSLICVRLKFLWGSGVVIHPLSI